jgi:60 kDa SS-A/Ro ribonucleoprotein
MNYLKNVVNVKETPQSEPIPGSAQVANSAGGFSFAVDDWQRLERFLILGSEGGSYYAAERKLTEENVDSVRRCVEADGPRVVKILVEISEGGRAPKNDPALFVLAMCASAKAEKTRECALNHRHRVARIGTHLFHFAEFIDKMRGWGPALRYAVSQWYCGRPVDELAYQVVKYQQRDGWTHRDLFRLAHPVPKEDQRPLFDWIVNGASPPQDLQPQWPSLVEAFETAKTTNEQGLIRLIREHPLTREMIPTEHQKSPAVWEALLENMPMGAMVRTLGRMGSVGLLKPLSDAAKVVADRLADGERIKKSRLHPLAILVALSTYKSGQGMRGSLTWTPVPQVIDALDSAFYLAFQNAPVTGKRYYLGLDVSGSMTWDSVAGSPLTPREAAAAMLMVTARTELAFYVAAFSDSMMQLPISAKQRLDDVVNITDSLYCGRTDCALPMLDALKQRIPVDVFIVYTDSETWAGSIHPTQALTKYRNAMGIPAKLIVVGMVSNGFTIANPDDAGMLDVVGFDTATPSVIADFAGAA